MTHAILLILGIVIGFTTACLGIAVTSEFDDPGARDDRQRDKEGGPGDAVGMGPCKGDLCAAPEEDAGVYGDDP